MFEGTARPPKLNVPIEICVSIWWNKEKRYYSVLSEELMETSTCLTMLNVILNGPIFLVADPLFAKSVSHFVTLVRGN